MKTVVSQVITVAMAGALVAGCGGTPPSEVDAATIQLQEATLQTWMGASKEDVIIRWGVPAANVEASENLELLVYEQKGGKTTTTDSASQSGSEAGAFSKMFGRVLGSLPGAETSSALYSGIGEAIDATTPDTSTSTTTVAENACRTTFAIRSGEVAGVNNEGDYCPRCKTCWKPRF